MLHLPVRDEELEASITASGFSLVELNNLEASVLPQVNIERGPQPGLAPDVASPAMELRMTEHEEPPDGTWVVVDVAPARSASMPADLRPAFARVPTSDAPVQRASTRATATTTATATNPSLSYNAKSKSAWDVRHAPATAAAAAQPPRHATGTGTARGNDPQQAASGAAMEAKRRQPKLSSLPATMTHAARQRLLSEGTSCVPLEQWMLQRMTDDDVDDAVGVPVVKVSVGWLGKRVTGETRCS